VDLASNIRQSLARDYFADVGDLTDLAERPGVREAIAGLLRSGALARAPRDVLARVHLNSIGMAS
jgi:hypothetical protein